jgi:hypothetical protein
VGWLPLPQHLLGAEPVFLIPALGPSIVFAEFLGESGDVFVPEALLRRVIVVVAGRHARHRATGLRALVANLGTGPHLLVVREAIAIGSAPFAHFRASAADDVMQVGAAAHEIRARFANIDAVEQQANVCRLNVAVALFDAMVQGLNADVVALAAGRDALLEICGRLHGYDCSMTGFGFMVRRPVAKP